MIYIYVFTFLVFLQKVSINTYDVKQNLTCIDVPVPFNIEVYTILYIQFMPKVFT